MSRAAMLALALLLLVPAAAAQLPPLPGGGGPGTAAVNVRMELQDPGGPLIPTRPYSLTVTVHYQHGPGAMVPPDPGRGAPPSGTVCGEVSVPAPPPWAAVRVLPPEICFVVPSTSGAAQNTLTNTTIVEVNVTEGAPALDAYNFTVAFDAPAQGTLAPAHGEVSRDLMPGFVGRLQVEVPPGVVVRGGAPQEVPITVRNLGNGPVEVRFRNVTAPQGVRVTLPERFVIAEPGGQAVVPIVVHAPWTTPVRGVVAFDGESSHATRPDMPGDSPRARLDLDAKAAVPGPGAGGALAALAVAGLVLLGRRGLGRGGR